MNPQYIILAALVLLGVLSSRICRHLANRTVRRIKPCPFCGSTHYGIGVLDDDREGTPAYIYCESCGAQGPWAYVPEAQVLEESIDPISAITGWDRKIK